jgi:cystathionine beta-lyase family protein involved in aluminum resistance
MTNTKQQTAVEWYDNQLRKVFSNTTEASNFSHEELLQQAKEMEKVKQKYFFDCGRQYQLTGEGTFNQVYNEIYGGNK